MADPLASWPTGRLLATAARAVENRWQDALTGLGITHAGLVALHLLDAPRVQAELARAARVEAQTMSRTLDRLERAGQVRREPDPDDRRRLRVIRTPEGERILAQARDVERDLFPAAADTAAFRSALLGIIRESTPER